MANTQASTNKNQNKNDENPGSNPLGFKGNEVKGAATKTSGNDKQQNAIVGKAAPRTEQDDSEKTNAATNVDAEGRHLTADGKPDLRYAENRHDPDIVAQHATELEKKEEMAGIDMRRSENRNDPELIKKIEEKK
jgi:hypothetical protein